ncbi:hypothetical protein DICPUDRAFT_74105 [Dictyostelium purpureum]|uniref:Uncharacterized protein n=1 Tax=Dictyostelium purpureum TaxID=5786 RepID=F0Z6M9_DICPU|nr:uncharacterized protein DICPUDRAFT_74105 [Dictyostelium purpureum]EGC40341.1 hypothetical protein DICPUDRAFT_74105 [Dictyostelium purpureum]|eukprot:XP_003283092.1 hypothetical protein DICPUDRAFT_74105 [Dictyostelium purpureum]
MLITFVLDINEYDGGGCEQTCNNLMGSLKYICDPGNILDLKMHLWQVGIISWHCFHLVILRLKKIIVLHQTHIKSPIKEFIEFKPSSSSSSDNEKLSKIISGQFNFFKNQYKLLIVIEDTITIVQYQQKSNKTFEKVMGLPIIDDNCPASKLQFNVHELYYY